MSTPSYFKSTFGTVIGVATFPYSTTAEATAAIPILYNSRSNCSHSHTLQQQKQLQPFHKMHYHDSSIVLMLPVRWSYELQFLLFYYCQISLHFCRFQRYFVLPFGITYLTSIMKVESSLCLYKLHCTDFCIYFHNRRKFFSCL